MVERFFLTGYQTLQDVLPIILIILFFQVVILRRYPTHLKRILMGSVYMLLGLTAFRLGLDSTLVPLGRAMAEQLLLSGTTPLAEKTWYQHGWLVLFAGLIGLAATLIEPTLIAVGSRVQELTAGELRGLHLRWIVAIGVALGMMLGSLRILLGIPILSLGIPLILLTGVLAFFAPKNIVPLALDTGPMATSVVTVPLVAAFGITMATVLPGRNPVLDGFGVIFFSLVMPVLSLLIFALVRQLKQQQQTSNIKEG